MSKSIDPIKNQLTDWLGRVVDFVVMFVFLTLILWIGSLVFVYKIRELNGLWNCTVDAWNGSNLTCWLIASLCIALSFTTTACVFAGVALWWRRAGERHHRGAQLIDERK